MIEKFTNLINRNERGFTLLELLVVSSIIGILAAIAIPSLGGARRSALQASCVKGLKSISDSEEMFYRLNGRFTDNWSELDDFLPSAYSSYAMKRFFIDSYSLHFVTDPTQQTYTVYAWPYITRMRLGTFKINDEGIVMNELNNPV